MQYWKSPPVNQAAVRHKNKVGLGDCFSCCVIWAYRLPSAFVSKLFDIHHVFQDAIHELVHRWVIFASEPTPTRGLGCSICAHSSQVTINQAIDWIALHHDAVSGFGS